MTWVPSRAPAPAVAAVESAIGDMCAEGFRRRELNDPEMLAQIGLNAIAKLTQENRHKPTWASDSVWYALGKMIPLR